MSPRAHRRRRGAGANGVVRAKVVRGKSNHAHRASTASTVVSKAACADGCMTVEVVQERRRGCCRGVSMSNARGQERNSGPALNVQETSSTWLLLHLLPGGKKSANFCKVSCHKHTAICTTRSVRLLIGEPIHLPLFRSRRNGPSGLFQLRFCCFAQPYIRKIMSGHFNCGEWLGFT